jgi:hypothetical protein
VVEALEDAGCEVAWREDDLNHTPDYPRDLYEAYRDRGCTDMTALAARRAGDLAPA